MVFFLSFNISTNRNDKLTFIHKIKHCNEFTILLYKKESNDGYSDVK